MRRVTILAPAAAAVALLLSEAVHADASRRLLGDRPGTTGSGEVLVVLGFRNRGPKANAINRARLRAAIRSRDRRGGPSRLLLCGGVTTAGRPAEARVLADHAIRLGVRPADIQLETSSRTTWQNIEHALPVLDGADRIKIVSDPLHAERARAYLHLQRPDLARRLVRARDYRFGELLLLKPVLVVGGLRRRRSIGARLRGRD